MDGPRPALYHITTGPAWAAARERGEVAGEALAQDGFLHCASRTQLVPVAAALFAGHDDLLVLCIDPSRVPAPVRWEAPAPPPGAPPVAAAGPFPHVYGPIPVAAVTAVLALAVDADGQVRLPGLD